MTRVLVVGGAGVFGRRLAEGLIGDGHEVVLAGRGIEKARAAARDLGAADAIVLDRNAPDMAAIKASGAAVVIDAAGPFQASGYGFARAVIAAGAHYLDLADARDFVAGFSALDREAVGAGVAAITGASSSPALTHAVVAELAKDWRRIDAIEAGISPGNRAMPGRSVIEAVLSWAGAPVRVFESGAWTTRHGWAGAKRMTIGGIGVRRMALAETPDLDLLVDHFAPRFDARFDAGLELGVLHHAIAALGLLRRLGLVSTLRPLAGLAHAIAGLFTAFGEDRGGMIVEVWGRDGDDKPARARWSLAAPAGKGPYVPTIFALALVRKIQQGWTPPPGARACVGMVSLDDVAPYLARHGVVTHTEKTLVRSPIECALGAAFDRAPRAVHAAHREGPISAMKGEAQIEAPRSVLAGFAGRIIGFPTRAGSTPAAVEFRALGDGVEIWSRRFGGRRFQSTLRALGPGRIAEDFGLVRMLMDLALTPRGVRMEVVGWRLAGIPMPRALAPRSIAFEGEDAQGRYTFDAPIALPFLGRLTHYRGFLEPQAEEESKRGLAARMRMPA